ncbi:MAG: prolyl oligopeptidase family serine peptidase [Synechococcales bacterium]|nr:prolyl oligopeptidase family serine peptidase [Synechococcales bacterium]
MVSTPGQTQTMWQTPPPPIPQQLDVPFPPSPILSPDHRWLVHGEHPPLPPIAELMEPKVGVAGIQLNPLTRDRTHAYAYSGLTMQRVGDSVPKRVDLPENARIRHLDWSFDSRYLAFTLTRPDGLELWILELETQRLRQLTPPILNATYGAPCDWLPADRGLICKVVPQPPVPPPTAPLVPPGPRIEENVGREAPARTFTNLLETEHDVALFEYYLTSVLEHISLEGDRHPLGPSLLIDEATPSPDGQWILLETIQRPFSYRVPVGLFPRRMEVINLQGESVYEAAQLPLADAVPLAAGSVRPGRRWMSWRGDRPATLYWVEALDGGDARQQAEVRDVLYQIDAPFTEQPQRLWQTEYRFSAFTWGHETLALASEVWEDRYQIRTWQINPSQPETSPRLLDERDWQDAYGDPGEPITAPGAYGWQTLLFAEDGVSIFLNGRGASPAGVFPFLDRWNLETGEKTRLWQAQAPYYERLIALLNPVAPQFITSRQSREEPPNLFLHDPAAARITPLTQGVDYLPWYAGAKRQVVRYERADGVQLSAVLYLPPGYDVERDGPLPTLLWVYPDEFKSATTASQVVQSDHLFRRPYGLSPLFLLTQGYAILNAPSIPIIGEGGAEPNDTYIEQLVLSAEAAIAYLTESGISHPQQIAVGGESYGAFTTANLLAHSDLFCAGIALNGAYNRTLTPFGFQGERRNFWEAQATYLRMSPFAAAASIDEPLLLIHGAEDDNAGTYPIQSERLYEALRGLGGTVRWVELPVEGHAYESREAIAHTLWEITQWLERCRTDEH